MSAPTSHLPFQNGGHFQIASDDDYYRFVKSYLLNGGELRLSMISKQPTVSRIFLAKPLDQNKIYKDHSGAVIHYLFENSHHLIRPKKDSGLQFLSIDEPMGYHAPPYITPEIIKRLSDDLETDALRKFFNGNIVEYLVISKSICPHHNINSCAANFLEYILETKPLSEISDIITKNDGYKTHQNDKIQIDAFKNRFYGETSKSAGLSNYLNNSLPERDKIVSTLKEKFSQCSALEKKVRNWAPLDTTPPKEEDQSDPKKRAHDIDRIIELRTIADARKRYYRYGR